MTRKILAISLSCIILSFFIFPVYFTFLPESVNSKIILAVVGIFVFVLDCIRQHTFFLSRTTIISASFAILFSVWCFYSITTNGTNDTSYSRYWVSFATWVSGAYGTCWIIRELTGELDLERLTFYLALVCVAQCIIAFLIDTYPAVQRLVSRIFVQGYDFYRGINRLYGIGASLDVAGVRFSVILVMIAHQITAKGRLKLKSGRTLMLYFAFYAIITLLGSIIARTTWIGAILGLTYMGVSYSGARYGFVSSRQIGFWFGLLAIVTITVLISIWLYNSNLDFRQKLEFGFEGFFNWFETGQFRTGSTDKLNRTMWIWPEDPRTWIIGTGIFEDFAFDTDIGYCRFTLYCGLIGLFLFSLFFLYNGFSLYKQFDHMRALPFLMIALTFIVWIKVATDIFFIYALLFCLGAGKEHCVMKKDQMI